VVKPHPESSIDLGDLSVGAEYYSGGSGAVRSQPLRVNWERHRHRHRHRRWLVAVAVAALVLGLGGEVGQVFELRRTRRLQRAVLYE
jgi:hypothetical protein